jgi:dienelactone hydrolase
MGSTSSWRAVFLATLLLSGCGGTGGGGDGDAGADAEADTDAGAGDDAGVDAGGRDDAGADAGAPDSGTADGAAEVDVHRECVRATDCGVEDACNFMTGRCEPRATSRGDTPRFIFLHPVEAAPGDFLILDGEGYFGFFPNPSISLEIGSSSYGLLSMEVYQNRMLLVRETETSGPAVFTSNDGTARWDDPPVVTAAAYADPQDCGPEDLPATGAFPDQAAKIGPYAAGFADSRQNGGLRLFYPAQCGGLRRPPAVGTFPVVLILHGDGAASINYEYLGRHLATWGFIALCPVSAETADLRAILADALDHPERFLSALAGRSAGGTAAAVGHSKGAERASLMFKDGETRIGAVILLGPCSADSLLPVCGMVFGATGDLQSIPIDYNYNYSVLAPPRYLIVLQGGNHSQFTDHRHWEGLAGGDLMPTMTRNRQFEIVQGFTLAFLQRTFGQEERFPQWLQNPGLPDEVRFERDPP